MPPRTRAITASAPVGRVYVSTPAQEQVKFRPRKKLITHRHSTGTTSLSRQETLTQMDFVNFQHALDDNDEIEELDYDIQEKKRTRKRRRTDGDGPRASHHTQTLTQLDFVSTPATTIQSLKSESSEKENVGQNTIENESKHQIMGPPTTPCRRRIFEVPSSQSPVDSPFSVRSMTPVDERSPLKEKSVNTFFDNVPEQPASELLTAPIHKIPKFEIKDTFDYSDESQQTRICSTPDKKSSAIKSVRFAMDVPPGSSSSNSMLQEIEDSEAESDDGDSEGSSCYGDLGLETQLELDQIVTSSNSMPPPSAVERETIRGEESTQSVRSQMMPPSQDIESQYTQGQRLSTQHVQYMSPRSPRSDIFLSIHPDIMEEIVDRTRDHEFRNFKIPSTVSRLWFYEKDPKSRVKYMASIGSAKQPGDIESLEGYGNENFNSSNAGSNFAYEILQVYELADPLSLKTLKANAWMETPPTRYTFVRPAVLDAFIANLKCSLFNPDAQLPVLSQSVLSTPRLETDSQEAEAQLQSTIRQFTQTQSSQIRLEVQRASQATTVDLTQQSNVAIDVEPEQYGAERDESLIPESPSRLSPFVSSPTLPRNNLSRDTSGVREPFSMSSSQLLTRSQMLPESLLDDSIPSPPSFIGDSEEDDDEL